MTTSADATTAPAWPVMSLAQAHAALTAPGSPFEIETIQIDGRPVKWWKNAPPTLRHTFMAAGMHREKTLIVYEDDRVTFDAFIRASLALAAEFQAAGVKPGDRVALAMRNLPEWPVVFFAGVLSGAVVVALNAWWSGPELLYGLTDSGATIAVMDPERLARVEPLMGGAWDVKRLYVCRSETAPAHARVRTLESVIGRPSDWPGLPEGVLPAVEIDPEDPAVLFYTSGTSGVPKGALGTHRNAGCSLMAAQFSVVRSMIRRGEAIPTPDPAAPQRAGLVSIPFFHTTGCNAILLVAVALGQKLVCQRRFDPGEACALIEREGIQSIGGVPAVAIAILSCPERANHDLSSLEIVAYGGAPAPETLVRKIAADMHAAPGSGWGMTETSATHTHHLGEDYLHRPLSCGPAMPVSEVKVVDEDGNALPSGQIGELMAYGPNIVKGYWNKPQETVRPSWTAGSGPATSPASTRRASSSSSTARRTSSSGAARTSTVRRSRTSSTPTRQWSRRRWCRGPMPCWARRRWPSSPCCPGRRSSRRPCAASSPNGWRPSRSRPRCGSRPGCCRAMQPERSSSRS